MLNNDPSIIKERWGDRKGTYVDWAGRAKSLD